MRKFVLSFAVLVVILGVGIGTAYGVCVPTVYNVTSSAPPPIGNWTDTSGAVWTPAGGFPGCAPGDAAQDLNPSPTTLIINSSIPNPIIGLNLSCGGCAIDIQSGGSLTIAGAAVLDSATTITVEPGGTLTIANAGTLTVQNGASLNVNGGFTEVQTGGKITFNGASTVTNGGTLAVNGGTLEVNNLFTIQSTGQVTLDGATVDGTNTIDNNGTLTQNGGNSTLSCTLNGNGGSSVNVSSGMLSLSGTGSFNAPITILGGGVIDFPTGSSYTMTPNGIVDGTGTLAVSGGTLSIGGVTAPANFTMSGGTLTGAGFLTVRGDFNWSGGTITGTGGTQIEGTGHGLFTGADGPMTLDGRAFDDYGYLEYSATSNSLTIGNGSIFSVYGTFDITDDGMLDCNCSVLPQLRISPNGDLVKSGGAGTFTIDVPLDNTSQIGVFSGELEFSANNTHTGAALFGGTGTTLRFDAPTNTIDAFFLSDGDVAFTAGTADVSGFYEVHGKTTIEGPTVTFNDPAFTEDFAFNGGTLDVDDFFVNNDGTWSGGTIQGSYFTVGGDATMLIDCQFGGCVLTNAILTNDGTINYAPDDGGGGGFESRRVRTDGASGSNHLVLDGGAIVNDGTFDLQNDEPITIAAIIIGNARTLKPRTDCTCPGPNEFHNNGTLKKTGGSGTTSFEPDLTNTGFVLGSFGTIDFENTFDQSDGATTIGPGAINGTVLNMTGGVLDGSGNAGLDVQNNGGTVQPGTPTTTGILNIDGDYTQGSGGTLAIKIGGSASNEFDQVTVTGVATLDGTFTATLLNSYAPPDNTSFGVLTFASASGTFATQNLPTYNGALGSFTSAQNATDFTLTSHLAPSADVSVVKNGPNNVIAGQNIVYTIDVTNNGPDSAANVVVSDPTPANTTFVSASGGGCTSFPCNLGTLTSGQTVSITATYSTSPSFSGTITNTATVSSSTFDPDSGDLSSTKNTSVGTFADLAITKNGPNSVSPGQDIVYTITVTNNGASPATSVVVDDPTPVGLAFQSNTGDCTTAYPCNLGALNAGQSMVITSTYTVPANYASPNITNVASVSSSVSDPDNSNNSSQKVSTITASADLAISKTGPASVAPGQLLTYTITVSNLGPSAATSVVVSDPTPPGLVFVSNSGDCTTPFPCNIASLPSGGSAVIDATFNVPASYASTSITNTASVSSAASDSNAGNNSSTVTTPVVAQSDVAIVKNGPASFVADADVVYTLTVTNNGPLVANNVFVDDPTPAGVTFVSNSGACSGPFPCGLGSLAVGQSVVITTTFHVPANYAGTTLVNTASVSSSTIDVNSSNNSSTATTPRASGGTADLSVQKSGPPSASTIAEFIIAVTNNGPNAATGVVVNDPTPAGLVLISTSAPCNGFPCVLGVIAPQQTVLVTARYFVQAAPGSNVTNTASASSAETDPSPANNTASATVLISEVQTCPSSAPQLIAPVNGASVSSPVNLSWTAVVGATQYTVTINGPNGTTTQSVANTSTTATLGPGAYTWTVSTAGGSCPTLVSVPGAFVICGGNLTPPLASAVAESTTGQTYTITWNQIEGASTYELQQSNDTAFAAPDIIQTGDTQRSFTKLVSVATPFFYRVRAISSCGLTGPFSPAIRVVVVPVPGPNETNININIPAGSTTPVTWQIFVPGQPGGSTTFIATADKPWLSVSPTSGIVPSTGILITISADPATLPNGTWTGTILVVYGSVTVARAPQTQGTPPPFVVPVSVSLVTPVTPGSLTTPSASALIIPAVGHLAGLDSTWRSDVRLANTASLLQKYRVTFNNGSGNSNDLLQATTLSVDGGTTTALDDVVRKWFGTGSLGESSNGALVIEPLDPDGKVSAVPSTTTTVSSRTFNATATGTLGQFIPALGFGSFINKASNSILSLQQLAQTSAYRSNLGLLEASGKSANVLVSAFDSLGLKLFDLPVALRGGEQKQLNALLGDRGLTLSDARVQVRVTDGDGKVTTYASVVDNTTGDPFLVFGVPIGGNGATKFVVPGLADLQGNNATWRSDVRLFNSSALPQTATLTFFPSGDPAHSSVKTLTVAPGEVKALDGVLQSFFGLTNIGGALHVSTPAAAPLVVSARTYDQRPGGTVGQFIPAVAPNEAVALNGRSLQILQTEESARFYTNVGIAETTGQAATVEIQVHLPDSKITPVVRVPLAANEFRQLNVLGGLNLGALYNTRISVRVVDGEGRVTAYGSVIDRVTGDPTYIPGQL